MTTVILKGNVPIARIVIPKEELATINNKLRCTQPGCNKIFTSSSNFNMHLWKSHKIEDKKPIVQKDLPEKKQYHCPEEECKYSLKHGRFFSSIKLLKQHYLHVHADKNFKCDTCSTWFPTQAAKNYHSKSCGCQCICSCGKIYDNEQTLKVHAYRKKHKLPPNVKVKVAVSQTSQADALPAVQLMAAVALSELCKPVQRDAEVQTEQEERQKRKQTTPSKTTGMKRRKPTTSQETQTQSTSSTILQRAMIEAKIPIKAAAKRKRNTQTQTARKTQKRAKKAMQSNETQTARPALSTMTTCTSPFERIDAFVGTTDSLDLQKEFAKSDSPLMEVMSSEQPTVINDVGLPEGWINQKSTQTMPADLDYPSLETLLSCDYKFQSSETQTDLFDESFLDECEASLSINTETQTCSELNESLENMLYSNMCTQTCDELLSSLDFVDIETQTFGLD